MKIFFSDNPKKTEKLTEKINESFTCIFLCKGELLDEAKKYFESYEKYKHIDKIKIINKYKEYFKSKILKTIKKVAVFLNPYNKICSTDAELLHVPLQYSPIYGCKIPVITTMHDVQEFHFPTFFDAKERLHRAINSKKSVEESRLRGHADHPAQLPCG